MATFNLTESNIRDHSALMAHIAQLSESTETTSQENILGIQPCSESASPTDTTSHETIPGIMVKYNILFSTVYIKDY